MGWHLVDDHKQGVGPAGRGADAAPEGGRCRRPIGGECARDCMVTLTVTVSLVTVTVTVSLVTVTLSQVTGTVSLVTAAT